MLFPFFLGEREMCCKKEVVSTTHRILQNALKKKFSSVSVKWKRFLISQPNLAPCITHQINGILIKSTHKRLWLANFRPDPSTNLSVRYQSTSTHKPIGSHNNLSPCRTKCHCACQRQSQTNINSRRWRQWLIRGSAWNPSPFKSFTREREREREVWDSVESSRDRRRHELWMVGSRWSLG